MQYASAKALFDRGRHRGVTERHESRPTSPALFCQLVQGFVERCPQSPSVIGSNPTLLVSLPLGPAKTGMMGVVIDVSIGGFRILGLGGGGGGVIAVQNATDVATLSWRASKVCFPTPLASPALSAVVRLLSEPIELGDDLGRVYWFKTEGVVSEQVDTSSFRRAGLLPFVCVRVCARVCVRLCVCVCVCARRLPFCFSFE
ncbi:hypothetical protein CGRA01v4_11422 [Colletotrichum graminicola]|nr:hypothetical protein CGRA01v4_11422 [Colletotrichum graminicola]